MSRATKARLAGLDLPAPAVARPARAELQEQASFCRWLDSWLPDHGGKYHAVVNEGRRSPGERARVAAQGLRKGVPDMYVFLPAVGLMAIEFKRADGRASDVRPEQRAWLSFIGADMGPRFFAAAAFGWLDAVQFVRTLYPAAPQPPT
jgi:hypothetical protein